MDRAAELQAIAEAVAAGRVIQLPTVERTVDLMVDRFIAGMQQGNRRGAAVQEHWARARAARRKKR